MPGPEIWQLARPSVSDIERTAAEAEAEGWDGLVLTDSQNLSPDTYVALTLAARATRRLRLGPGVTNPVTRDAAVTAGAIASIQQLSAGRAVLGIGRGDSALFNIGQEPAKLRVFEPYVRDVQAYLSGETTDKNGYPSRLQWLDAGRTDKVPMDIAATGPRVIALAARHAERIGFAVGADPRRLHWAITAANRALPAGKPALSFGAYVNVCVHEDVNEAADLLRGLVGTFAHFTGMHPGTASGLDGRDRRVFQALGEGYERPKHGHNDAAHARALPLDFIERFAVVGPPGHCVAQLRALLATGVERLFVIGPRPSAVGEAAVEARTRFVRDVMPALRAQ
jgi:5,10-methylenetetrahydromethanopterin reductase